MSLTRKFFCLSNTKGERFPWMSAIKSSMLFFCENVLLSVAVGGLYVSNQARVLLFIGCLGDIVIVAFNSGLLNN